MYLRPGHLRITTVSCAFTLRSLGTTGPDGEYAGLMGRLISVLEREQRMSWEDADTNVKTFLGLRYLRALRDSAAGGRRWGVS